MGDKYIVLQKYVIVSKWALAVVTSIIVDVFERNVINLVIGVYYYIYMSFISKCYIFSQYWAKRLQQMFKNATM